MSRETRTPWDAHHRRGDVLRAVIETADARRDGVLPSDVPGVPETFGDEFALVTALQMRWHTRLAGNVERALAEEPADLEPAVLRAWRRTADDLAGVRAILDAAAEHPATPELGHALERANRKDWALLAAMAGRASAADSRALGVGRDLERTARAGHRPAPVAAAPASGGSRRAASSLVGRLRAHLAA